MHTSLDTRRRKNQNANQHATVNGMWQLATTHLFLKLAGGDLKGGVFWIYFAGLSIIDLSFDTGWTVSCLETSAFSSLTSKSSSFLPPVAVNL